MPLSPQALHHAEQSLDLVLDTRWAMGFAAGIPDDDPLFYATDRDGGVVVHPLFPVAAEWQLIMAIRGNGTGLSTDEVRRGIHVGHDLILHQPLDTAGTTGRHVHLTVRTVAVGRHRAGATQTLEFVGSTADTPLWRTRMTSLYLGVELDGEPLTSDDPWPDSPHAPDASHVVPLATETSMVRTIDAHAYSECARIWNPIHTDVAAARNAGLTAPILHGTAILARAVSASARMSTFDVASITRIGARFAGQVALGSSFDIRLLAVQPDVAYFDAVLTDGRTALRDSWCSTEPITPW